ncbi:MAG: acetamidase/formamidase family protein [Armatimonadetes bacterium]|nr:acetamidase/formamidase family protein [Armatimonadota bacterium]
MARTHYLPEDVVHYAWDHTLPPALEVDSGDVVVYQLREVTDNQISPRSTAVDLGRLDWNRLYPLGGPVFVRGARPGDVLEVEILDLHPLGWAWSAILPGFGLLEADFTEPYLHIWDLSPGDHTVLRPDIRIPLDPFCGTMGVAPAEKGPFPVMPPGKFGGNMDTRHLTCGTRLLLPVQVDGALFSVGDGHAAQGDGEVCVTGMECPMHAALRFHVRRDRSIAEPQFTTPGPLTTKYDRRGYHATMGVHPDLMEAARNAVRHMIDHLVHTCRLSREQAYILCSVAVDLKISECVDKPNWIVSAYVPLAIFVER